MKQYKRVAQIGCMTVALLMMWMQLVLVHAMDQGAGSIDEWMLNPNRCGEAAAYSLSANSNGLTLSISGSGALYNFNSSVVAPWMQEADRITAVEVASGITSIGEHGFYGLTNAESITLPDGLLQIGMCSFQGCASLQSLTIPASVERIGDSAFMGCSQLKQLVFLGDAPVFEAMPANRENFGTALTFDGITLDVWVSELAEGWSDEIKQPYRVPNQTENGTTIWKTYHGILMDGTPAETHIPQDIPMQPATCLTEGKKAGVCCQICGQVLSGFEAIPKTPHVDENQDNCCDDCGMYAPYHGALQEYLDDAEERIDDGVLYSDASRRKLLTAIENAQKLDESSGWDALFGAAQMLEQAIYDLKEATVTVSVTSSPQLVALLQGGGRYAVGEAISLKASPLGGYTFVGWQLNDGQPSGAIRQEIVLTGEEPPMLHYVAVFRADEQAVLTVKGAPGAVNYQTAAGDSGEINGARFFPLGSLITLTAPTVEDQTFLYWTREDGRIISSNVQCTIPFHKAGTLYACYGQSRGEGPFLVVFQDGNGKVLKQEWVPKGADATPPQPGRYAGLTFREWSGETTSITRDTVLIAQYSAARNITICWQAGELREEQTVPYGQTITCSAPAQWGGKHFVGWKREGKFISYSPSFSFAAVQGMNLIAEYADDEVKEEPIVSLQFADQEVDAQQRKALPMVLSWQLPQGNTLLGAGIRYAVSAQPPTDAALKAASLEAEGIYEGVTRLTGREGSYVYTLTRGGLFASQKVWAVGWLQAMDERGERFILYTPIQACG